MSSVITSIPGLSGAARAVVLAVEEVDDAGRELDARVRKAFGINANDLAALRYIDWAQRRGQTVRARDLAARLHTGSGAATEIVNRLERAGLLEREIDPTDARARILRPTGVATERLDRSVGAIRARLNDLLLTIPDSEEGRLVQLLNEVRDIVSAECSAHVLNR